jgi:hypothetical protein
VVNVDAAICSVAIAAIAVTETAVAEANKVVKEAKAEGTASKMRNR